MSRKHRRGRMLKEAVFITTNIGVAFEAAFRLYGEWKSPEGPAVVTDVACVAGGWEITCRIIKFWGKEAWL